MSWANSHTCKKLQQIFQSEVALRMLLQICLLIPFAPFLIFQLLLRLQILSPLNHEQKSWTTLKNKHQKIFIITLCLWCFIVFFQFVAQSLQKSTTNESLVLILALLPLLISNLLQLFLVVIFLMELIPLWRCLHQQAKKKD